MLDKSIEYKCIIMRLDKNKLEEIGTPVLPDGFSFRFFEASDIDHWSRIETTVLEFTSEDDARDYFARAYLPYIDQLHKRCLFVLNPDGVPVATTNAWFADSELGHQASVQWVSVCPEYQGQGIGKAMILKALSVFRDLEPGQSIWLQTQTWSHVAVRLYHNLGFNLVRNDRLANMNTGSGQVKICPNDFDEAIHVLRTVMDAEYIDELINTAE